MPTGGASAPWDPQQGLQTFLLSRLERGELLPFSGDTGNYADNPAAKSDPAPVSVVRRPETLPHGCWHRACATCGLSSALLRVAVFDIQQRHLAWISDQWVASPCPPWGLSALPSWVTLTSAGSLLPAPL